MQDKINFVWLTMLNRLLSMGQVVYPRGFKTRELLHYQSTVPMQYPVLGVLDRKMGRKFMAGEAAWILSGDNRVQTIAPFSKAISNFSDDGIKFFGSYGTKILPQINYVVDKLAADKYSREAVINIWRENPPQTKDYPCTCTVQFIIRDDKLYCIDNMRSSDVWLGWPYDIFNFSMVSAFIALKLREEYGIKLELGDITLNAGSQHIYENNFERAKVCIDNGQAMVFAPLDLNEFDGPYDLLNHLWNVARSKPINKKFLKELYYEV